MIVETQHEKTVSLATRQTTSGEDATSGSLDKNFRLNDPRTDHAPSVSLNSEHFNSGVETITHA